MLFKSANSVTYFNFSFSLSVFKENFISLLDNGLLCPCVMRGL